MVQSGQDEAPAPRYSPQAVHLVRTAQVNTLTLSQMADQKAQILMGASFVVFSLVITEVGARAVSWSMLCLAATAFLASIIAVAAILPRSGPKIIDPAMSNPLFFAYFALREEDEWTTEVLRRLETDEGLYRLMLRDLYQNGLVLQRRKYRLLAHAYKVFLAGLAVTLLVYLVEATAMPSSVPA